MKHHRWLVLVFEQQLVQDIEKDGEGDEGAQCQANDLPEGQSLDKPLNRRQQCR